LNIREFWKDVLEQNAEKLKSYFHKDAVIRWHCTNELFTVEEYIRANCEYPGDWDGEIERTEETGDTVITATKVYPVDKSCSFHVVSFLRLINGVIVEMDEYWGDDGVAPEWRRQMKIGKSIKGEIDLKKNTEINVMTWNTGMKDLGSEDYERCDNIISYIKKFLESNDNPIVVLQEIPFKKKEKELWKTHPNFQKLKKEFGEAYKTFYNSSYNNGYIIMMTVIITKNESNISKCPEEYYPNSEPTNRESGICFDGISILGVHARGGKDNESYLKSINGKADIILGDFNAGDYDKSENRVVFNNILSEHVNVCVLPTRVDPKTKRRTCIDHVFIKDHILVNCGNLVIHEDIHYSDHFPITFRCVI